MDSQTSSILQTLAALVPGDTEVFWLGTLTSLFAGLGTTVGALAIFFFRRPSARMLVALISGAAGIMLAASFFSLLQPAFEYAGARLDHRGMAAMSVVLGVFMGAALLFGIHRYAPHEHFQLGREGPDSPFSRLWLFVIAITLHNFPEGMAVGVGFADEDISNGIALGIGIGLQNVPEGLAVAVSMLAIGYRKWTAFWVACLTGLVEPVGGVFGAAAITLAAPAIPVILGVAAGGMLFIISDEIIPETHRGADKDLATFSLLIGVVLMMSMSFVLE